MRRAPDDPVNGHRRLAGDPGGQIAKMLQPRSGIAASKSDPGLPPSE